MAALKAGRNAVCIMSDVDNARTALSDLCSSSPGVKDTNIEEQ